MGREDDQEHDRLFTHLGSQPSHSSAQYAHRLRASGKGRGGAHEG